MSIITERLVTTIQKPNMLEKHSTDSKTPIHQRSCSKPEMSKKPEERTVDIVSPIAEGSMTDPAHSHKAEKRADTAIVLCEGETYASYIINLIQGEHSTPDRTCDLLKHDPAFADKTLSQTEDFYQILGAVFELFAAKKEEFCKVIGDSKDFKPAKSARQLDMVAYMYRKGVAARVKDDKGEHEAFDRVTLRDYIFELLKIKAGMEEDIARFKSQSGRP